MNYLELLRNSYEQVRLNLAGGCPPESRLAYLASHIFQFVTYDDDMDKMFARRAVEVCDVLNKRTNSDHIEDAENYRWYLLMCNMPFFADKLDWGTSIRGAWWAYRDIKFESCGLWDGEGQLSYKMTFKCDMWKAFMCAVVAFAEGSEDIRREPPI